VSGTPAAVADPPAAAAAEPGRPPDLRLAGFAVATWLAALACLYLSARLGLLLAAGALVAAVAAAALCRVPAVPLPSFAGRSFSAGRGVSAGRRSSPGRRTTAVNAPRVPSVGRWPSGASAWRPAVRWIGMAMLLGMMCGAVATAARVSVREAGPLAALVRAGASVQADLIVRDDPRALHGSPGLPPTYLVAVDLTAVRGDGPGESFSLSARALVLASDRAWSGLLPGQRATAAGRLLAPRGGDLRAAVLSVQRPPTLIGHPGLSGPRGYCGPGCSGRASRCPTTQAGCCPAWWWGTPDGSIPPWRRTFALPA
jgi:competence protein ComEC